MNVITLPPKNREQAIQRLSDVARHFLIGKPVNVEFTQARSKRTIPQNKYLFGVAYPIAVPILNQASDPPANHKANEWHEYFLGLHFGWTEVTKPGGRKELEPRRTTTTDYSGKRNELSTEEFWDFVEFVRCELAERGIIVPDPEGE